MSIGPKIFVHIGPGKTGTTSFQTFLKKRDPNFITGPDLRDMVVHKAHPRRKELFELLGNDLSRDRVISSEFLPGRHRSFFEMISDAQIDPNRVEILIVAREHASHFRSMLQQRMKSTHKTLNPESALNYQRLVSNWAKYFRVKVLPYQERYTGALSIVQRLAEHTNLSKDVAQNKAPLFSILSRKIEAILQK